MSITPDNRKEILKPTENDPDAWLVTFQLHRKIGLKNEQRDRNRDLPDVFQIFLPITTNHKPQDALTDDVNKQLMDYGYYGLL